MAKVSLVISVDIFDKLVATCIPLILIVTNVFFNVSTPDSKEFDNFKMVHAHSSTNSLALLGRYASTTQLHDSSLEQLLYWRQCHALH